MFRTYIIYLAAVTYVLCAMKSAANNHKQNNFGKTTNRFNIQPGLVEFLDFGNKEIKSISVSGCNRKACNITNGQTYNMTIVFQANQDSSTAYLTGQVLLNGTLSPPIDGIDSNGCNGLTPQCPIKRRGMYSITRNWTVTGTTPGTNTIVIGTLYGTSGILEQGAIKFNVV